MRVTLSCPNWNGNTTIESETRFMPQKGDKMELDMTVYKIKEREFVGRSHRKPFESEINELRIKLEKI